MFASINNSILYNRYDFATESEIRIKKLNWYNYRVEQKKLCRNIKWSKKNWVEIFESESNRTKLGRNFRVRKWSKKIGSKFSSQKVIEKIGSKFLSQKVMEQKLGQNFRVRKWSNKNWVKIFESETDRKKLGQNFWVRNWSKKLGRNFWLNFFFRKIIPNIKLLVI